MSMFRSLGGRRRRRMQLHDASDGGYLFVPCEFDQIQLTNFADAARAALDLVQSGLINVEALLLLDEQRQLVGALCDAPGELGLIIGSLELPDVAPFCQVIDVVVRDRITLGPPDDDDRAKFLALRRRMAIQGLLLLDVLLTNADLIRSLAIGCDPDPIWFEPFEPLIA